MSGKPFVVHEYVRWSDVDPEGIIRYDAYARFMEIAEGDFFRSVGVRYGNLFRLYEIGIPRRVMHLDFLSSPVLDEELEVRVYISHIGTTSLKMNFTFNGVGGVVRAVGYFVIVCVDLKDGRHKRPWPPELLELMKPYTMGADDASGSAKAH